MAQDIASKLVIAIASSALFRLDESDAIFEAEGEDAYRRYQREHESQHFEPGVAFAFIKQLLSLNVTPEDAPVEVVLLSRNDPDTGLRVMNSIEAHRLGITRAAFVKGRNPYRYVNAFNASLFLSANEQDVREALAMGIPAGLVVESALGNDFDHSELRIAFDFDGVIADDSSESVYNDNGLEGFHRNEVSKVDVAHEPGPLHGLLMKIAALQRSERGRSSVAAPRAKLRLALVTARGAPAHKRVVTSLRKWGVEIDETFFLGGIGKAKILAEFKPHLFFDDQVVNLGDSAKVAPCVHVPFGLRNKVA